MIYRNKRPDKVDNFIFALCMLLDAVIRVISLGFFAGGFSLRQTRNSAKRTIQKMYEKRAKEAATISTLTK